MQRNEWDLSEPPGARAPRPRRRWPWLVPVALLLALVPAAPYIPLPMFYAFLPGPVRDVAGLIQVERARTYSSEGHLYLTTINVDTKVSLREAIEAWLDPNKALVERDQVVGTASLRELTRQQRAEMQRSKQHAQEVALVALGLGAAEGDGARVTATGEGAPAAGRLQPGDVIVAVDGQWTETACDVGRAIDSHQPGDEIHITLARQGRRRTVSLRTTRSPFDPTAAFVGVAMEDVNYRFDPGFEVNFDTGRIGGPSAGLMMALALYDRLEPEDLTGGRAVAGTGEIECDGGVRPIGGIEQKVAGAESQGAQVFLAPVANYDDAKTAAHDIEVVAISNFDDAIAYLRGMTTN